MVGPHVWINLKCGRVTWPVLLDARSLPDEAPSCAIVRVSTTVQRAPRVFVILSEMMMTHEKLDPKREALLREAADLTAEYERLKHAQDLADQHELWRKLEEHVARFKAFATPLAEA
jgi:hypothetical protein